MEYSLCVYFYDECVCLYVSMVIRWLKRLSNVQIETLTTAGINQKGPNVPDTADITKDSFERTPIEREVEFANICWRLTSYFNIKSSWKEFPCGAAGLGSSDVNAWLRLLLWPSSNLGPGTPTCHRCSQREKESLQRNPAKIIIRILLSSSIRNN